MVPPMTVPTMRSTPLETVISTLQSLTPELCTAVPVVPCKTFDDACACRMEFLVWRDAPLIENDGHTDKACKHQSPLSFTLSGAQQSTINLCPQRH